MLIVCTLYLEIRQQRRCHSHSNITRARHHSCVITTESLPIPKILWYCRPMLLPLLPY